jgi:copper transport protein
MRLPVLLATLVALVLQAGAAWAHATLVSSDPADGAVLAAVPSRLVLTFNEPVSPLVLRLIDDKGEATTLAYHIEDTAVVVDRPGAIGRGSHALSWRVISADGHPVGGTVLFSVGAPSAGAVPGAAEVVDWPLRAAIWICRLALYLGFFAGIGALFFATFVAPADPPPRNGLQRTLLIAGIVAVPDSVGLQGLDALELPLSDFGRSIVWQTAMGTTWGLTAVIALAALLAALASTLLPRGKIRAALGALAFLGVGAALAASGHASAAEPQWLTRPAVFIHALAVTFWVGALLPLADALRREGGGLALARFSAAIPFAIVPLLLAGIALAIVQVEKPVALLTTAYGNVLIAKLALVAVLFLLASLNRWRLTTPAEAGAPSAKRKLVLAILVEAGLAVAILGVVATWRFTPPPRSLEAAAAQPVSVHIHTAKAMADVTFSPGHVGPVTASIVVMTGDFGPLDAKEVTLTLSNPAAGIESIRRPASKPGDGTWRVDDLIIPLAGRWDVEVAILVSEFELVRLTETIDIRP